MEQNIQCISCLPPVACQEFIQAKIESIDPPLVSVWFEGPSAGAGRYGVGLSSSYKQYSLSAVGFIPPDEKQSVIAEFEG